MSFRLAPKLMTLNDLQRRIVALTLRYFTEFGSFRDALCKMVEDVVVKKFTFAQSNLQVSFSLKVTPNSFEGLFCSADTIPRCLERSVLTETSWTRPMLVGPCVTSDRTARRRSN